MRKMSLKIYESNWLTYQDIVSFFFSFLVFWRNVSYKTYLQKKNVVSRISYLILNLSSKTNLVKREFFSIYLSYLWWTKKDFRVRFFLFFIVLKNDIFFQHVLYPVCYFGLFFFRFFIKTSCLCNCSKKKRTSFKKKNIAHIIFCVLNVAALKIKKNEC